MSLLESAIEERIISLLEKGPHEKATLLTRIQREESVSVQGIYKALRTLKRKEVIISHEKIIGLSLWWINRELERFARIARMYGTRTRTSSFLDLRSGEYMKLRFRTLRELELYWTQAFLLIEKELSPSMPIYSVIPHDWFYYARPESDAFWVKQQNNRVQRLVLTHPLPIDRYILRIRNRQKMEVLFNKNLLKQKEVEYKNILGTYILEAKLDTKINSLFIDWMEKHPIPSKENGEELNSLLDMRGIFTIKISNAPRKASKVVSKLKKYFS